MSKRAVTLTSPPLVIALHVSNVPHFLFSFLLLLRHLLLQTTTAATPRYWFFSLAFVRIHPRKKGSDPTTLPAECHFGANNFAATAVIFPMDANFPKHLPSFHLKKRRALTKVAGVTQLGVGVQVNNIRRGPPGSPVPPRLAHEWLPPAPPGFGFATGPSGHRGIVLLLLLGRPQLTHVQSLSVLRGSVLLARSPSKLPKNRCHLLLLSASLSISAQRNYGAKKQSRNRSCCGGRGVCDEMDLPRCRQANRHAGQASRQSLPPPLSRMSQLRGADYP